MHASSSASIFAMSTRYHPPLESLTLHLSCLKCISGQLRQVRSLEKHRTTMANRLALQQVFDAYTLLLQTQRPEYVRDAGPSCDSLDENVLTVRQVPHHCAIHLEHFLAFDALDARYVSQEWVQHRLHHLAVYDGAGTAIAPHPHFVLTHLQKEIGSSTENLCVFILQRPGWYTPSTITF